MPTAHADWTDDQFLFIPFSSAYQHDERRLAFFRTAPPHGGNGALYLALGLQEIDAVLKDEAFGVPTNEARLERVRRWPLLAFLVGTMPFRLNGDEHRRAHDTLYAIVRRALSGPARKMIAALVSLELQRFKQACAEPGLFQEGVFDGEAVDIAQLFALLIARVILKLVGLPLELAPEIISLSRLFATVADRAASDETLERAHQSAQAFWEMLSPFMSAPALREGVCGSLFQPHPQEAMTSDQVIATVLTFIAVAAENPLEWLQRW